MSPKYDLDKIKFSVDQATFAKAVALYENHRVTKFENLYGNYSAVVLGSQPYQVRVSCSRYDEADCECYVGQNETLCKHMVAVAIYAIKKGKSLTDKDKKVFDQPVCSGRVDELTEKELEAIKGLITDSMKYIKPYNGPSRLWFSYQNSLTEGCNRLAKIVSELPVDQQTANILVDLLLRLDKKLTMGGVDDSDGTVGCFIEETVQVLKEYVELDSSCVVPFKKLIGRETCFGWEESLLKIIDKQKKWRNMQGYFNDDGQPVDMKAIEMPELCRKCRKYGAKDEEIICNLNRFDQQGGTEIEHDFICGAFESKVK